MGYEIVKEYGEELENKDMVVEWVVGEGEEEKGEIEN